MGLYFYNVIGLDYVPLKDGLTFGRNKADVTFPDDGRMSGLHAKVNIQLNGQVATVTVEDLNSKNRTSVDRAELEPYQPQKLMRHAVVEMGNQKFILTESNNLDIHFINSIIERFEVKPIVKLEGRRMVQEIQNKVVQKVEALRGEHRILMMAVEEVEKKIKAENEKIKQVDAMKAEFLKKQEQERSEYFSKMEEKITVFRKEIEKHDEEKLKLNEKAKALDEQIQTKAERVKKED